MPAGRQAFYFMIKNFLKLDWINMATVFLLLALGLTALYSVSWVDNVLNLEHFNRQIVALILGLILATFFASFDYRLLSSYSTRFYFVTIAMLLAVFFLGTTVRGTTGWIGFENLRFQPVEIVKLIMIIFLASFLSKKKTELEMLPRIIASIVLVALPVYLVLKQPDFGSAAVIIAIWIGMLIASGINKKSLAIIFLVGVLAATSGWFILKNYQKARIINFVKPSNDPLGSGYNVIQSIVAVGSGGIFGKGLGHGSQSQLNFLPEKHTDFIFASIAEELGMIGSAIVLILYGTLLYRLKETARLARDNFGYLVVIGIIIMIFVQIFINIGMNIGIVPVAGVPLPLLSFGGSSLITILASLGIIQSVFTRRMKTLDPAPKLDWR